MTGSQIHSSKLAYSTRVRPTEFGTGSCTWSRTCGEKRRCLEDTSAFDDSRLAEPSTGDSDAAATAPAAIVQAAPEPVWFDEEWANAITHGLGLALSVAGAAVLWMALSAHGSMRHVIGCGIYGGSLVALYGASTLYHCVREKKLKRLTQLLDHVCIYLLIAGTYTPILLIALEGVTQWALLATVWLAAAAGIVVKLRNAERLNETSFLPYVALGGLAVLAIKPLLAAVPMGAIAWLIGGGIFYVGGVVFYANDHRRMFHAVWHLFVVGGSVCHYLAVLWHLVPGVN